MSFGGNDVKFADTVTDCLQLLPKTWGQALTGTRTGCMTTDAELTSRIKDLTAGRSSARPAQPYVPDRRGGLADFYDRVASAHLKTDGLLVVVGYPRLIAPSEQWAPWRGGRCQHISAPDADMLGRAAELLNTTLKAAVIKARAGLSHGQRIVYVDRLKEFDNDGASHSLCGNDTEWLTGVVIISRNGEIRKERSFHPNEVGHQVTAEVVAGYVDDRLTFPTTGKPAPETDTPEPEPTTEPPPISDGGQHFGIRDEFAAYCSVAWPTAPTYTSNSIVMTMSCPSVPQQYLFVQVTYPDPGLPITPSTGRVLVHGRVVNTAKSAYGYQELIVTADKIDLKP